MKKGSGKPSGYRKRSATGKKPKVVQRKKYSKWWSTPSVSTISRGRGVLSNSLSSYSSRRQISPLPESVATDHFRQVGSFSTAGGGGSGTSVPESTSIVISSSEHVSDEGPRQRSLQEEVRTLLLKGAVELVNPPLTPGFYSHLFLVPKKNGKMRPVIDLSVLN